MRDILILAVKALAGGVLVVGFALLSEGLGPKRFAGLFGAAPAVALAGLSVVLLDKGAHEAQQAARAMIAGGVGMVAYAAAVVPLLRRLAAPAAGALAVTAWATVSALAALPLLLK